MVIKGYKVPKGTLLVGVLAHVLADPRYWENPHEFKPERFITEEGTFKKYEQFVPFGIGTASLETTLNFNYKTSFFSGKRYCLGDQLARAELLLVFVRLMQKFRVEASPDHPPPTLESRGGTLVVTPLPYYAVFQPRV